MLPNTMSAVAKPRPAPGSFWLPKDRYRSRYRNSIRPFESAPFQGGRPLLVGFEKTRHPKGVGARE